MKKSMVFMLASVIGAICLFSFSSFDFGKNTSSLRCENEWGVVEVKNTSKKKFDKNFSVDFQRVAVKPISTNDLDIVDNSIDILAAYDISILDNRYSKWQPNQDGVNVEVCLAEKIDGIENCNLDLIHCLGNGRYEFVDDAKFEIADGKVSSFSFVAKSFSIYAIVDRDGNHVISRNFYHFYSHPKNVDGTELVQSLPYEYVNASNEVVNVQIVKNGEYLVDPPVPPDIIDENGYPVNIFEGWYEVKREVRDKNSPEVKLDSSDPPFTFVWPKGVTEKRISFFDPVEIDEAETNDVDIWLVPLYEHARFIEFCETELRDSITNEVSLVGRRLIALNDETRHKLVLVSDVTAPLQNSRGEYFSGWKYLGVDGDIHELLTYTAAGERQDMYLDVDDALFEANGGNIIRLWPMYVEAHFLNFDASVAKGSGASYVGSMFIRSSGNINQTQTSSRKGYSFDGWYVGTVVDGHIEYGEKIVDSDGNIIPGIQVFYDGTNTLITTDSDGNIRLDKDITLYAQWTPNSLSTYQVILWKQKTSDPKDATSKSYDYAIHYISSDIHSLTVITEQMLRSFSGKTQNGQNVSNLNLLDQDFLGFHYSSYSPVSAKVEPDGTTAVNIYYDRDLITFTFIVNGRIWQTMDGLYGQSLDSNGYVWPTEYWWYDSPSGNGRTRTTFLDAFIPTSGESETFYGSTKSSTSTTIRFYKQNLSGGYDLANTVDSTSGGFNISDKYDGYKPSWYRTKRNSSSSWSSQTNVGSYNANTGYYGSQISNYTELEIYFDRIASSLVYMNDGNVVYQAENVVFGSSLAGFNIAWNDPRIGWGDFDISHYMFNGWYEDASLTVPFDFSSETMPAANKQVYAKWTPVKYKVVIDPAGGELGALESTWFYVDYNEKIIEYTPTRNYKLDMRGQYYYCYNAWDPANDKHTDQYDPANSNAPRRAFYTTDISQATDTFNRYVFEPNAYRFMGWFQVKDGELSSTPFNFNEYVTEPIELRAIWQRSGLYVLEYESIDPDGKLDTTVVLDPVSGSGGYIDESETIVARAPANYDPEKWIWEGWQVVDTYNLNAPLTELLSPGDKYMVQASHANIENIIKFKAVYQLKDNGQSSRIPSVVDLVLDSNADAMLSQDAATNLPGEASGSYANGVALGIDGLNQGLWFSGKQNNFAVDLSEYSSAFIHTNNFLLIGWDTNMIPHQTTPAFSANQIIGIDSVGEDNVLYAIWEPQIYIEFKNETGDDLHDITLYIPAWYEGLVSKVDDTYSRSVFTNFHDGVASFDLKVGENLKLVIPDGLHKDFTVMGHSTYEEGTKLVIDRISPHVDGEGHDPSVEVSVYPDEEFMVSGTMHISSTPTTVIFKKQQYPTSTVVPVRYFLHELDGSVIEITSDEDAWSSSNYKTNLTVSSSVIDLAAALRVNENAGVHEFLSRDLNGTYGHTTIGIGSASAVVTGENFKSCEYRSITKSVTSGGSYIKYNNEKVEWSRYSVVWNPYEDAAVYVVFYRRVPMHVTVVKNVIGTDSDLSPTNKFSFTATFEEKSVTYSYKVSTPKQRERQQTSTRSNWWNDWGTWDNPRWETDIVSGNQTTNDFRFVSSNLYPFAESRSEETFKLANNERNPITLYYNRLQGQDPGQVKFIPGSSTYGNITYNSSWGERFSTIRYRTETTNYTEVVEYVVSYQFETAKIKESFQDLFDLHAISRDLNDLSVGHAGYGDIEDRSYVISSMTDDMVVQPLDAVIFANKRKTGSIEVAKQVDGDATSTKFHFTVTLGETVVDKSNYAVPEGVHLGPYGKVFSFDIAAGEHVVLPGLPAGASYAVKETPSPLYKQIIPANSSGIITEGVTDVQFTNVIRKDIHVKMKDKTVWFNGAEQTGSTIHSVLGSNADTDDYEVTGLDTKYVLVVQHHSPAKGTAVGRYYGHFDNSIFTVYDEDNNDVTDSYVISLEPSKLDILETPIIIHISGNEDSVTYNGNDQLLSGYEYSVIHAETSSKIETSSIIVSVPHEYQLAAGKNVGTYQMYITPDIVQINAPAGYSVTSIVIDRQGSLEITPAKAYVTAKSLSKLYLDPDPTLEAETQGLFAGDSIEYSLSREPGEDEGAYAIYVACQAKQGNYIVECNSDATLSIIPVKLVQRSTGSGLNVERRFTADIITSIGYEGERDALSISNYLNQTDKNMLMRWENLVAGIPYDSDLMCKASSTTTDAMEISSMFGRKELVDLGYTSYHVLLKHDEDAWTSIDRCSNDTQKLFSVRLLDASNQSLNASGFYRLMLEIIPDDHPSITNSLCYGTTISIMEASSSIHSTMVGVPWKGFSSTYGKFDTMPIVDVVQVGQLQAGDMLHFVNNNGDLETWELDESKIWKFNGDGDPTVVSLDRGSCFWLERNDTSLPFFLIGQYASGDFIIDVPAGTPDNPSYTMVPNLNFTDIYVNDIEIDATPGKTDYIQIPNDAAISLALSWKNNKGWGKNVVDRVLRRSVFKNDYSIPNGTGVWYINRSGSFRLKIGVYYPSINDTIGF